MVELILGDCLEVMKGMPDNSVDTIITDPPYGLEFMGKAWDKGVPGVPFWAEMLRVAKPGACLMAMGGTRTYHRLVCAIEDAGWRIIDMIEWLYGSGFPKSLDISKSMDRAQGAERENALQGGHMGYATSAGDGANDNEFGTSVPHCVNKGAHTRGLPATPEAQLWDGWGTALKPAHEPICVAYKPREGTYVENALKWGVAGLWIDGGRVEAGDQKELEKNWSERKADAGFNGDSTGIYGSGKCKGENVKDYTPQGRFPSNVIHDGSDEVLSGFPETISGGANGNRAKGPYSNDRTWNVSNTPGANVEVGLPPSSGSAARFFYCAKASRKERNAGLEQNHHPTVKPIELMRYLVRLTKTPTGGIVLDPFMGSGTTGIACVNEGRDFIGIEQSEEYLEIARRRIEYWQKQKQPRLL